MNLQGGGPGTELASLPIMGSAEVGSGVREELVITGSLGAAEIISGGGGKECLPLSTFLLSVA